MNEDRQALRYLPSVETLAKRLEGDSSLPRALIIAFVQREIQLLREEILKGGDADSFASRAEVERIIADRLRHFSDSRIQSVINATGVIIHTNLGRSPLGRKAADALTRIATGYCNLEFNLPDGTRGKRAGYLETALASLLAAEAATAVNNCAAALVIILRHLCEEGKNEVIVSRGELVEIGGGFRIPDILETSGAKLVEVGATNKTNLNDYKKAISSRTAMILKVHRSNFYIGGFTEEVSAVELSNLAHSYGLSLIEDIGSGAMMQTDDFAPIEREPTPQEALRNGIDLVCFSGDKLLGGPQSGIIAGKKELVEGIKKEPFFRAVRCDKLILTALQECIDTYLETKSEQSPCGVPALEFIAEKNETLRKRANAIIKELPQNLQTACEVKEHKACTGGGTMPKSSIPSIAIAFNPQKATPALSVNQWATNLRIGSPPVVGSIENDLIYFDLRTVFEYQDQELTRAICQVLRG